MAHEVQLHYFAAARELAGCAQERLPLPVPSVTLEQLKLLVAERHLRLAPHLARMRFAINDELNVVHALVHAGDEIAILPPVAGGSGTLPNNTGSATLPNNTGSGTPVSYALLDEPLSVDRVLAAVKHAAAGGIVLFLGVVRDHAAQGAVARLDYEAHAKLAEKELARILTELAAATPGTRLCAHHRLGSLVVGDIAVIVAASAAHRGEAFSACRAAIDALKQTVPIWKKEYAPDGSALWVNFEGT